MNKKNYFKFIDFSKRKFLLTGHRRESFGEAFKNICYAIKKIADNFDDVKIVYQVHLNSNVQKPVKQILSNVNRVRLIDPLDYPYFIRLMNKYYFVLTDSGGIQEKAPALGKPVLVMREVIERQEGVDAVTAILVGSNKENIYNKACILLKPKLSDSSQNGVGSTII